MNNYYWRTTVANAVYVDADTGDDLIGDGSQNNPYQTLGRAWRGSTTKPGTIVCRGRFCENMADGNHAATIRGDAKGAAVFDGANTYTIFGFNCTDIIVLNCTAGATEIATSHDPAIAGVGRAHAADYVGGTNAFGLFGLAGSGGIVGLSGLYFGIVGGMGQGNCIFNPKCNEKYKLFFFGYNIPSGWNIHGVKIENRQLSRQTSQGPNGFRRSIFSDCAFISSDHLAFGECVFTSDCTWWKTNMTEQIIPEGDTSEEKIKDLAAKLAADTSYPCTFTDCIFLDKTAEEIYNDVNHGDFTLKLDSEVPAGMGSFNPALIIPVMDNSDGIPGTWDEKTATGLIKVEDNKLVVDTEAEEDSGSIQSKVITIDLSKYSLKGLVTPLASKFADKAIQYWSESAFSKKYYSGETLPNDSKFKVLKGSVTYDNQSYEIGDLISTVKDDIEIEGFDIEVGELKSCNIENVCYIRSCPAIYKTIDTSEVQTLDEKTTYMNVSKVDITVTHNEKGSYVLKPNESIVGITSNEATADSVLAILFDSNEVPEQAWVPVQLLGNSFVVRKDGDIVNDEDGVPLGSGNFNYWKSHQGDSIAAFNQKYIQLKFDISR